MLFLAFECTNETEIDICTARGSLVMTAYAAVFLKDECQVLCLSKPHDQPRHDSRFLLAMLHI